MNVVLWIDARSANWACLPLLDAGANTYPSQLQRLLDASHGNNTYSVTNMGAAGAMMLKNSSEPFWKRPQYVCMQCNAIRGKTQVEGRNGNPNGWGSWFR